MIFCYPHDSISFLNQSSLISSILKSLHVYKFFDLSSLIQMIPMSFMWNNPQLIRAHHGAMPRLYSTQQIYSESRQRKWYQYHLSHQQNRLSLRMSRIQTSPQCHMDSEGSYQKYHLLLTTEICRRTRLKSWRQWQWYNQQRCAAARRKIQSPITGDVRTVTNIHAPDEPKHDWRQGHILHIIGRENILIWREAPKDLFSLKSLASAGISQAEKKIE